MVIIFYNSARGEMRAIMFVGGGGESKKAAYHTPVVINHAASRRMFPCRTLQKGTQCVAGIMLQLVDYVVYATLFIKHIRQGEEFKHSGFYVFLFAAFGASRRAGYALCFFEYGDFRIGLRE
jgi:hypothetical protein